MIDHHRTIARREADEQALEAIFAALDRDGYSGPLNTPAGWRARERQWTALYHEGTIKRARVNGALVWVLA